jgi:hypothetical protein
VERSCVTALCICQSQLGSKLTENALKDGRRRTTADPGGGGGGSGSGGGHQFFGVDIAHAVREIPFMPVGSGGGGGDGDGGGGPDPAAVAAAFLACANQLYGGACTTAGERLLCELYVTEWFASHPSAKVRAVAGAAAADAVSGSAAEWVASLEAAAVAAAPEPSVVGRVAAEREQSTGRLVANACVALDAAFKFNTHMGPVEMFENRGGGGGGGGGGGSGGNGAAQQADLQSSIRILAESIESQLPAPLAPTPAMAATAVGKFMMQECLLMNARISAVTSRLRELDMRASNKEMTATNDMSKQLTALHLGTVPRSWLGGGDGSGGDGGGGGGSCGGSEGTSSAPSSVQLSDWIGHLQGAAAMLRRWVEATAAAAGAGASGRLLSKVRMGYVSNAAGLLVAFREDVVRAKGWPAVDAYVELEPVDGGGRPRSSAPADEHFVIEGVQLVGATFSAADGLLSLAESEDTTQSLNLCVVCRHAAPGAPLVGLAADAADNSVFECPVYTAQHAEMSVTFKAASPVADFTRRSVRVEAYGADVF